MINCLTIGTWEVRLDGKSPPASLTWRKNFALLVYLARSPKRTRTRDHLIGLLWAEKPDAKARRSLNVALTTLRGCLGEGGLSTESDRVRLAGDVVRLDIDRFEQLAQVDDLKGAAEFFVDGRHTFLDGLVVADAPEFEDWLTRERATVAARAVDVLTRRSTELLDLGRTREAIELARRALTIDDVYEPALRAAMRALAMGQDRSGALTLHEQFTTRVRKHLGAAPDAETEALASRLRRDWAPAVSKPASLPEAPASEPARRAALEERAEALARLLRAWRKCWDQPRRSVLILEGDPGMGKTRLLTEFTARARVDGAVVASIRAVEGDLASPWNGIRALCHGGLLTMPGASGAAPAALAALREELSTAQLGPALNEAVQAICEEQALVIVLDDGQWLDRESLLALFATLRDPRPAPLALAVATTREPPPRPEIDEVRSRLGRDIAGAAVRLGPLAFDAIRRMARWTLPLGSGGAADAQLDRLARRVLTDSAGIPLLAVALLDAVSVGLDLGDERQGWPRPGQTLDHTFPGDLPDNVVGAIRVMFGRASPDAQRLLVVLAVLGSRVSWATLERATGLSKEKLIASLAELEWRQWVTAEPRGYAFVARILGEVVNRDMVTEGERLRIRELAQRA